MNSYRYSTMNKILILLLAFGLAALTGCRENKKKEETINSPSEAEIQRLKSDSERLQQATANAAREREKASQAAMPTATPGPKADLSPRRVPPQPANPTP